MLLDALRLCIGLVDLVDRDNDRHLGRLGVIDGFERLRHYAVIGRHHQHHDVGNLRAAGAHAGKRLMARSVDKDNLLAFQIHLVCADMLRNSAGFAPRHVGFANGVQQRGLAVIHMSHDRDHGRALHHVFGIFGLIDYSHGFHFVADGGGGCAELAGHFGGQLGIEGLVDGGEDAAVEQLLDHQVGFDVELLGQLFDRDALRNCDLAIDRRRPRFHLPPLRPQDFLFLDAFAWPTGPGGSFIAWTPARWGSPLGPRRRRHTRFHAAPRCGMLRTRATRTRRHGRARTRGCPCHHGLPRTNGPAVNRLARHRRAGSFRNSGPGLRGRLRHHGPRGAQFRHQIGARWNYRAGRGLACQRTALRRHRHGWRGGRIRARRCGPRRIGLRAWNQDRALLRRSVKRRALLLRSFLGRTGARCTRMGGGF